MKPIVNRIADLLCRSLPELAKRPLRPFARRLRETRLEHRQPPLAVAASVAMREALLELAGARRFEPGRASAQQEIAILLARIESTIEAIRSQSPQAPGMHELGAAFAEETNSPPLTNYDSVEKTRAILPHNPSRPAEQTGMPA